jgi:AraC-like DNA-binding protein
MNREPAPAKNQARFAPLAGGVTLMQASFADHAFERHSHDSFAIGLTTYGVQSFRCNGALHDSRAGDFVLFNPDQDHDGHAGSADGFRYTIWYVPEDFVASCLAPEARAGNNRYFAHPHVSDRAMAAQFAGLSGSLQATPSESLRAETLMRDFLHGMLSRHGERPETAPAARPQAANAMLARVRDCIRSDYRRDITVAELAALSGMSRAHLTRAFGAAFGTPPHVYLNTVRIARARTLIRDGMPLAAVAAECGFADQSHLTRRFKGSMGVTPSAWRDSVLRDIHRA